MGKLKSVLTAKKKEELLRSFKANTVCIINLISASEKSPADKIALIESVLVLSEIIDLEQERIRYELLQEN